MQTSPTTDFFGSRPLTPVLDVNSVTTDDINSWFSENSEAESEERTTLDSDWGHCSSPRSEASGSMVSPTSSPLPSVDLAAWMPELPLSTAVSADERIEARPPSPLPSSSAPSKSADEQVGARPVSPVSQAEASSFFLSDQTHNGDPTLLDSTLFGFDSLGANYNVIETATSSMPTMSDSTEAEAALPLVNDNTEQAVEIPEYSTLQDNMFPPAETHSEQRMKESKTLIATTFPKSLDIASTAFKEKGEGIFKDGSKVAVQVGLAATLKLSFKKGCFSAEMEGQEQPKIGEEELLRNVERLLKTHERGPHKGVVKALLDKFQATGNKSKYFNWKRWLRAGLDAMPALFEITSYKRAQVRHFTLQIKWGNVDEGKMNRRTKTVIGFINSKLRDEMTSEDTKRPLNNEH